MADLSERYEANWDVALASPVLVRVSISYAPGANRTGPTFRQDLVITPDGLLSTVVKTSTDDAEWGVTWPILENDGHPLQTKINPRSASTSYASDSDEQTFFAIDDDAEAVPEMQSLRSTYGDLRPVRVVTSAAANHTFVYPHTSSDPEIAKMHESITVTETGYRSLLGRVDGNLYVGRTAAGGMGSRIDLDNDGKTDVSFSSPCVFILQLHHGKVTAVDLFHDPVGWFVSTLLLPQREPRTRFRTLRNGGDRIASRGKHLPFYLRMVLKLISIAFLLQGSIKE